LIREGGRGSLIALFAGVGFQREKRDYYLTGHYMRAFNDKTLAIANAWLDPEVPGSIHTIACTHGAKPTFSPFPTFCFPTFFV
jgi:hypothetical protein